MILLIEALEPGLSIILQKVNIAESLLFQLMLMNIVIFHFSM